MATLFSHLLAARGLAQPQFKALFEQTAHDLGLAGLTVADRTFRRWITGETVRPVNATLVVLSHLFPEVRPIERLLEQVAPDGTPVHAGPSDRARIQEQALRDALATVGRRARDLGWQAVIGEAQRESATADEARAFSLRIFQNALVPALLQVPAYTRAVFEAGSPPYPAQVIEAGIEDRASRQEVLARPDGPFLYVVLAECVLGCPVGGLRAHRQQLLHLLEVSRLPRIDLRVLPTDVGAHPSMDGGFELIDFAANAEPPAAYHFTNIGSLRLEDRQVGAYRVRFESLTGLALSPERSRELVEGVVSRLPEEPRHDQAPP